MMPSRPSRPHMGARQAGKGVLVNDKLSPLLSRPYHNRLNPTWHPPQILLKSE